MQNHGQVGCHETYKISGFNFLQLFATYDLFPVRFDLVQNKMCCCQEQFKKL